MRRSTSDETRGSLSAYDKGTVRPRVRCVFATVPRVLLLGVVSSFVEREAEEIAIESNRTIQIGNA